VEPGVIEQTYGQCDGTAACRPGAWKEIGVGNNLGEAGAERRRATTSDKPNIWKVVSST